MTARLVQESLGSFAVLLRGETESVAFAASLGLNFGKKGTKLHLCQQQEPGMSLQQQPGCRDAGVLSRPHSQDSLVTLKMALFCPLPCPCEAVAARNPAVTLPLHPHPSAEPFLSLLLVLTEIDFSLDLQVQW